MTAEPMKSSESITNSEPIKNDYQYLHSDEQLKALVIEDDPFYMHLVKRYIHQDRKQKYTVDTTSNAMEGIELCISNDYDIVLLDYNLPDLNGAQFLREMAKRYEGVPPPAIILTAEAGEVAASGALRANAADFLPKKVVTSQSLSRSMHNAISKNRLQRSVYKRTTELETVNNDLMTKNREIRDFYQKVSHEVKTPLAAIREFVSIVRDGITGEVSDEQTEVLDYAITSCDQIANHFNDLVQVTRLDSGKVQLEREPVKIASLLTRSLASVSNALKERNIHVQQHGHIHQNMIDVDGNRITQVLSNLLGNAVKYSPSDATVDLTVVENEKGEIEFSVADSGEGIEEKYREKIFDRLYQIEDENHEELGAGLGLGLSIAEELVHLHGGEIWVTESPTGGADFRFTIPV